MSNKPSVSYSPNVDANNSSGRSSMMQNARQFVSRRSKKADIVTGATSAFNTREQIAMIRPIKERKAMGKMERRQLESRGWIDSSPSAGNHEAPNSNEKPQYTLQSRRMTMGKHMPFYSLRKQFCCLCSSATFVSDELSPDEGSSRCLFIDVNRVIADYLSWTFRTSYFLLFTAFAVFYFANIIVFAFFYWLVASGVPECINSAGQAIGSGENSSIFADCFQLSWTTFSTVGYGIVFPSTGASGFYVPHSCVSVGTVGSLEAFLGVLYAGFCGAILFGKVTRAQSRAQVLFSDPIVVRFGKQELTGPRDDQDDGVKTSAAIEEDKADEEMGGDDSDRRSVMQSDETKIPCPSFEFRLVNRLHDIPAGEIVEAQLDCVAILDPKLCRKDLIASLEANQNRQSLTSSEFSDDNQTSSDQMTEEAALGQLAKALEEKQKQAALRGGAGRSTGLAFHSADSKKPRVFCKLSLDADEHPFFRRVWFGRHKLDENSPLLTQEARNRVKENGGYWPADRNNYQAIRDSLHFRHILVSFTGTSNANAASVYAQKVYDLVDVNVGYRFVPMNYHDSDGMLRTDKYLLNAVYQQRGGGGEPF